MILVLLAYAKLVASRVGFVYNVDSVRFEDIKLENPLQGNGATVPISVGVKLLNNNPFDIVFTNLSVQYYSDGVLLASSSSVNTNILRIPAGNGKVPGILEFMETINFYANIRTVEKLAMIKLKKPIKVDYYTSFTILLFGFKINKTVSDNFTIG